jgi:DNA-binding response OmpR family regulator
MGAKTGAILVVDDEHEDLIATSAPLRANGYRVLEASTYDTALGVFGMYPDQIDLLLTDISLPGNNGCELARALLGVKPGLKVLFVSGYAGAEVCRFYGLSASDVHFLRKPFKAGELLDRVRAVLDSAERLNLNMAASQGQGTSD